MIKITVDLYPFGGEKDKEQIGALWIVNDGTGDGAIGNYKYHLLARGTKSRIGKIEGFPREEGFWKLLYNILEKELKSGNKKKRTNRATK